MQKTLLALLVILAFLMRYQDIDRPIWIDEAKFVNELVKADNPEVRELIPYYIAKAIGKTDLRNLRMPFILFSTFTVLAIWFVIKDKRNAMILMVIISIAPLYTYWGSMARPYTVALFFVVLGWRWPIFYVPAILTTPFAIVGLNLYKIKEYWYYYAMLIIMAFMYYYSMQLSKLDHFNLEYFGNAKRLWLIPLLVLGLYCADFSWLWIQGIFEYIKRLVTSRRSAMGNKPAYS